jgi:hypothetical protein
VLAVGLYAYGGKGRLHEQHTGRSPASELVSPFSTEQLPRVDQEKWKVDRSQAKRVDRFARFRVQLPRKSEEELWDEAALSQKSTIQKIYDAEMRRKLEERYQGTVLPLEREAQNPTRRASYWEKERYEDSRKDLAHWTLQQIGTAQARSFLRRKKGDSALVGVVAATSGLPDESAASATKQEKSGASAVGAASPGGQETAPPVPTQLKAHLNLLKTQGQFTFTNPVVTTSVEARGGSGENLAVELDKDFQSLAMSSKLRYGVDESNLQFNVNKKITDEFSLDLNSQHWTGSKHADDGSKGDDTARLVYSLSF